MMPPTTATSPPEPATIVKSAKTPMPMMWREKRRILCGRFQPMTRPATNKPRPANTPSVGWIVRVNVKTSPIKARIGQNRRRSPIHVGRSADRPLSVASSKALRAMPAEPTPTPATSARPPAQGRHSSSFGNCPIMKLRRFARTISQSTLRAHPTPKYKTRPANTAETTEIPEFNAELKRLFCTHSRGVWSECSGRSTPEAVSSIVMAHLPTIWSRRLMRLPIAERIRESAR